VDEARTAHDGHDVLALSFLPALGVRLVGVSFAMLLGLADYFDTGTVGVQYGARLGVDLVELIGLLDQFL